MWSGRKKNYCQMLRQCCRYGSSFFGNKEKDLFLSHFSMLYVLLSVGKRFFLFSFHEAEHLLPSSGTKRKAPIHQKVCETCCYITQKMSEVNPFIKLYKMENCCLFCHASEPQTITKIVNEKLFQVDCLCILSLSNNPFSSAWQDHITETERLVYFPHCLATFGNIRQYRVLVWHRTPEAYRNVQNLNIFIFHRKCFWKFGCFILSIHIFDTWTI